MSYSKEQLREKYLNLPENIKEVFDSVELLQMITDTCSKFNLHIDQQGELANEVGLILLGITRPDDFLGNIQNRLKISLPEAGEIVKELNQTIFFPIRASLETLNNGGVTKYNPERPPLVENFSPAGQISEQNIYKPQTPLQNSGNNAIIINKEVPKEESRSDRQVFDEKMGKLFRLPKEEIDLGEIGNSLPQKQKNISSDPYKEPIQ